MKILFAYEHSGFPSEFFAKLGHDVHSVDLKQGDNIVLRTHHQADAFEVIMSQAWDMMIAFPPCTFLARASTAHINSPGRREKAIKGIETVKALFRSSIPLIAVENPIGFLSTNFSKPSQIIYPWQFGDPYTKDICLWLKNLPPLVSSNNSTLQAMLKKVSNHTNGRMSQEQKSEIKSSWRHFPNLCFAMAHQWSSFDHNSRQKLELFPTC